MQYMVENLHLKRCALWLLFGGPLSFPQAYLLQRSAPICAKLSITIIMMMMITVTERLAKKPAAIAWLRHAITKPLIRPLSRFFWQLPAMLNMALSVFNRRWINASTDQWKQTPCANNSKKIFFNVLQTDSSLYKFTTESSWIALYSEVNYTWKTWISACHTNNTDASTSA